MSTLPHSCIREALISKVPTQRADFPELIEAQACIDKQVFMCCNWLTYWSVKSNMLLVRVEILVLLPAELADVAPSFCRQEKAQSKPFCFLSA